MRLRRLKLILITKTSKKNHQIAGNFKTNFRVGVSIVGLSANINNIKTEKILKHILECIHCYLEGRYVNINIKNMKNPVNIKTHFRVHPL